MGKLLRFVERYTTVNSCQYCRGYFVLFRQLLITGVANENINVWVVNGISGGGALIG